MLATWMCQKKHKVFLLSEKTKVLDVIKEEKITCWGFPEVFQQLGQVFPCWARFQFPVRKLRSLKPDCTTKKKKEKKERRKNHMLG